MKENNIPVKFRILGATVDCIDREGLQELTIRKIAKEAGVNSAAINYYFGTKENLIEQAMNQTMTEMAKMPKEIFETTSGDLKSQVETFFVVVMDSLLKWRGIAKAHLYAPLIEGNYNSNFVTKFNEFMADIEKRMIALKPKIEGVELKIAVVQLVTAVMFPGLISKMFIPFSGLDFEDAAVRRSYVHSLVARFFPSQSKGNASPNFL